MELQKGIYGDSQFYSGVGDFYLMNTCNRWTAKGLKSIGMDISPTLKLTAGSVMNYLTKAKIALTIESTRTCKNGVLIGYGMGTVQNNPTNSSQSDIQ